MTAVSLARNTNQAAKRERLDAGIASLDLFDLRRTVTTLGVRCVDGTWPGHRLSERERRG